ncbi:MAG TPA: hypothetical protein VI757_03535 [Bacteroidia bacterium]|nr:hypothetical protein [Bacteroidia bacterium]
MKKNYDTIRMNTGQGVTHEKKVLLAKIILVVCILILIAAKSFGQ